ncbi:unnamed protein product [Urochloa humidicola]
MDPMEFPPGDTTLRPQVVFAAAARTQAIREEERALELFSLVAVQRDGGALLTCAAVLWDAPCQLGIPEHEMAVEGLSPATFLLRFGSTALRNVALAARAFQVGNFMLNIMPWSRRIGAAVGRLRFRARVCLEGVPRHARNAATIAQLFSNPSFVDEINCPVEKEEASFCFNAWIWTEAPNDIALQGTLHIQELVDYSSHFCNSLGSSESQPPRDEPAKTFDYTILIHLDHVLDYTPSTGSPGRYSYESDTSGIPSDDPPFQEYPAKFDYTWYLGVRDGDRPPGRTSVHDRLGGRDDRPDRQPPRGHDGSGGSGFRQWPLATRQDVARMNIRRQWDGGAGGSGGYGRRYATGDGEDHQHRRAWRPKQDSSERMESSLLFLGADAAYQVGERLVQRHCQVDPMVEEAEATSNPRPTECQSARSQRSVEPTATTADLAMADRLDGARGNVDKASMYFRQDERTARYSAAHATLGSRTDTQCRDNECGDHAAQEINAPDVQTVKDATGPLSMATQCAGQKKHVSISLLQDRSQKKAERKTSDTAALDDDQGNGLSWSQKEGPMDELPSEADTHAKQTVKDPTSAQGQENGLNSKSDDGPNSEFDVGPKNIVGDDPNGPLFDLNMECGLPEELDLPSHEMEVDNVQDSRKILGTAEGRLNKEARDNAGHKSQQRGLARLAIPLKKSLLCNPTPRPRTNTNKKNSNAETKRIETPGGRELKGNVNSQMASVDDKATLLLLKSCGVAVDKSMITEDDQIQFGAKFVMPLQAEMVSDMRGALGMAEEGGAGCLHTLAGVADE